jgi:DNA-3-methyladenine glycosylase II
MSYVLHLQKDKKLRVILGEEVFSLKRRKNIPVRLMASIMSQQLSTKVAAVIYQRFLHLYDGKEPSAATVLDTPDSKLRSIGLSNAKVQYVKNVAAFFLEHGITESKLMKMDDATVIELLTQIKGVGRWTVEMLLMFSLGREDVFAVDDLGIQQAMIKRYRLDTTDKKQLKLQMQQIANKWKPYRTYACLHLWAWKDTN